MFIFIRLPPGNMRWSIQGIQIKSLSSLEDL